LSFAGSFSRFDRVQRAEVVAYRIHAQQLDRAESERGLTDAAIFDVGVQDTGTDGASWALANRGVPVSSAAELQGSPEAALAWTLRISPHYYRRQELPDVLVATSPFSEADAAKRLISAAQPLQQAGIAVRDGLAEVAAKLRTVVTEPMAKGDVSTRLTPLLDEPYHRDCQACGAIHVGETPFRMAALYAGLELEPGTSPPVLRRIPGWPERTAGPADDPLAAPEHLQPIRNYLRFLGPATPRDVAAFLDTSVTEVKKHWPDDAVAVRVDGAERWLLQSSALESDPDFDLVRLLGGFDLLLQGRDRDVLVPDTSRHKALWPPLGRPGAVLVGTEIVGTWRPKTAGARFTLRLHLWTKIGKAVRQRLEAEAVRLAAHRGLTLAGIEGA
jgi:Winged helix DNA-binding domain